MARRVGIIAEKTSRERCWWCGYGIGIVLLLMKEVVLMRRRVDPTAGVNRMHKVSDHVGMGSDRGNGGGAICRMNRHVDGSRMKWRLDSVRGTWRAGCQIMGPIYIFVYIVIDA